MVMMAVLTLKAVFDKKNPIDRKMLNRSLVRNFDSRDPAARS